MKITQDKLMDIAAIVALVITSYLVVGALRGEAAAVSEAVASTRTTVKQLTASRDHLAELADMQPLTTSWLKSRHITDSCGVQRTVVAGDDPESSYDGEGQFWTARLSGDAIAVLTCADQLSELGQVAFESVALASDDEQQSAELTFSMYGTFTPE